MAGPPRSRFALWRTRRGMIATLGILWVATFAMLWLVSAFRTDHVAIRAPRHSMCFTSEHGDVVFSWVNWDFTLPPWMAKQGFKSPAPPGGLSMRYQNEVTDYEAGPYYASQPVEGFWALLARLELPRVHPRLGPNWNTESPPYGRGFQLVFPIWLLVAVPGVLLVVFRKWLMQRAQGCCPACGYDLRGNPDAAQCPECGALLTRKA